VNPSLQEEILNHLTKMDEERQKRVLEYVRFLDKDIPIGVPGKNLLKFAGTIDKSDLLIMAQTIEEGCEQVNFNEW
jgi:hypothetical protein